MDNTEDDVEGEEEEEWRPVDVEVPGGQFLDSFRLLHPEARFMILF